MLYSLNTCYNNAKGDPERIRFAARAGICEGPALSESDRKEIFSMVLCDGVRPILYEDATNTFEQD